MITEVRTCRRCGNAFEAVFHRGTFAAYCPTCKDDIDHRSSIVIDRQLIGGPWLCVVESLPGDWEEFRGRPDDEPSWRIVVKGSKFGVVWSGRIDIYAQHDFRSGQVVEVAEIEVRHKVKRVVTKRSTSPFVQLRGGPAVINHVEHLPPRAPVGEEVIETRRYLRMDVPSELPENTSGLPRLVWLMASWKTTLKGLGRQYCYRLSGAPIASWVVKGQCRSGRFGTEAALAIVDDEHPLSVREVFNQ